MQSNEVPARSVFHTLEGTLKVKVWLFPRYEPVVRERVEGREGAVGTAQTQSFTVTRGRPPENASVTPIRRCAAAGCRPAPPSYESPPPVASAAKPPPTVR
jgi:hypothetical protein